MRRSLWFPLIAFLLIWPQAGQTADQCVTCHTDAVRLRALARAPTEVAEEEGAS